MASTATTELRNPLRDRLLITLTFAAGVADAVSFLGLGAIFTANMTGNTVFLALAIGQGDLLLAARSAVALLGFALGAVGAGRILGAAKAAGTWPMRVTLALCIELTLLSGFALGWLLTGGNPAGIALYPLIGLSALAMGIQSASARHLAAPGIGTTTVVTTSLTGLMAEFAALGISGSEAKRWTATILALFSGAAIGGTLMETVRLASPWLTTATVAAVCAVALSRFRTRSSKSGRPMASR
ncbi:MAG: YoaK family protein [Thermoplasmata archaeon]